LWDKKFDAGTYTSVTTNNRDLKSDELYAKYKKAQDNYENTIPSIWSEGFSCTGFEIGKFYVNLLNTDEKKINEGWD